MRMFAANYENSEGNKNTMDHRDSRLSLGEFDS